MYICHRCLSVRNAFFQRLRASRFHIRRTHENASCFTTWQSSYRRPQLQVASKQWRRGAKTKSSIEIVGETQGVLPTGEPPPVEEPEYPELLRNVRSNMEKFSHCVLLTKVGNFYEMYFGQAEELGPLLSLKVGKRTIGKTNNKRIVAMAGFPYFQLERYLKILVQDLSRHVAIVEEEDQGKDMPKRRRVERVITPGTLIDEKFMNPLENNFLLSAQVNGHELQKSIQSGVYDPSATGAGLAWLDLSSGEFFTQHTSLAALSAVVARVAPSEILLSQALQSSEDPHLSALLQSEQHIVNFVAPLDANELLEDFFAGNGPSDAALTMSKLSALEKDAAIAVLHYVRNQLQGKELQLLPPVQRQADDLMSLDKNTLRALEIRETIRDASFQGSLLHAVRRTKTRSGARLLSQRLSAPSLSLPEINDRLDLVTALIEFPTLREGISQSLRAIADTDTLRLIQKFAFGRGDADDLLSLSRAIQTTNAISKVMEAHCDEIDATTEGEASIGTRSYRQQIQKLVDRFEMEGPLALSKRILNAIDEERLLERHRSEDQEAAQMLAQAEEVLSNEGEDLPKGVPKGVRIQANLGLNGKASDQSSKDMWIMRRTANSTLAKLHDSLDELRQEETALQDELQAQLGPGVTLRWTPGLEYICHVKGTVKEPAKQAVLGSARLVRSSKSTSTFHLKAWTELGDRTDKAKTRIAAEEKRIFNDLRTQVIRNLVALRRNAGVVDELDVAHSFAVLAQETHLVRPVLNNSTNVNIVGGRHPTVEGGLTRRGRNFTSNNCSMSDKERILLITGPNMGGKSTFLRQTALIAILAQTGSYVPAEYAEIGLIDKIFSRVGSADNLYEDQSTFMVEMLETAEILKQATDHSFVIMDEVGRGTTPEDGIAVGFAALHHLYHVNKSRVLFATHFHTLTDMANRTVGISCYCTDVQEEADGSWTFVHRLRKGVNRQSHALKVAGLAGMPNDAVVVAANVLNRLHGSSDSQNQLPRLADATLG